VGLRAGLDDVEKKTFLTLPGIELDPSVVEPAIPTTLRLQLIARTGEKYRNRYLAFCNFGIFTFTSNE
jgi:hypothetical protein